LTFVSSEAIFDPKKKIRRNLNTPGPPLLQRTAGTSLTVDHDADATDAVLHHSEEKMIDVIMMVHLRLSGK
jgi:hypothetical protein